MHRDIVMPKKGTMRGTPINSICVSLFEKDDVCLLTPVNKYSGGGESSAYSKAGGKGGSSSSKPKTCTTAAPPKQAARGGDHGAKSSSAQPFRENQDRLLSFLRDGEPSGGGHPPPKQTTRQAAAPAVARVNQGVAVQQPVAAAPAQQRGPRQQAAPPPAVVRHNQSAKTAGISKTLSAHFGIRIVGLTDDESSMVSLPTRTGERNAYFAELFKKHPSVRIVDGYACIGGDTLSFMKWAMDNKLKIHVFAVQKKEHGRAERLQLHVDSFIDATGYADAKVTCFDKQVQDVIKLLKRCGVDAGVELLYFDPPWDLPEGFDLSKNHGSAKKPSEATIRFINRLEREVFGPLVEAGADPAAYVCLKAPTPFEEFSVALFQASAYLSGYTLDREIKVRNARGQIILYYHTLKFVGA